MGFTAIGVQDCGAQGCGRDQGGAAAWTIRAHPPSTLFPVSCLVNAQGAYTGSVHCLVDKVSATGRASLLQRQNGQQQQMAQQRIRQQQQMAQQILLSSNVVVPLHAAVCFVAELLDAALNVLVALVDIVHPLLQRCNVRSRTWFVICCCGCCCGWGDFCCCGCCGC